MDEGQLELPGMPLERTLDGEIVNYTRPRWFVVQNTESRRFYAYNFTLQVYGTYALRITEPGVQFYNSYRSAREVATEIPFGKVMEMTDEERKFFGWK